MAPTPIPPTILEVVIGRQIILIAPKSRQIARRDACPRGRVSWRQHGIATFAQLVRKLRGRDIRG